METRTTETHFCRKHLGKIIFLRIAGGALMAVLFFLLFGFVIQWIWNKTITVLFSTPSITYWQSVGIVILSRVLFGGCGHSNHIPFNVRKLHEHMKNVHRRFENLDDIGKESLQGYVERMAHRHGCKRSAPPEDRQKGDTP